MYIIYTCIYLINIIYNIYILYIYIYFLLFNEIYIYFFCLSRKTFLVIDFDRILLPTLLDISIVYDKT